MRLAAHRKRPSCGRCLVAGAMPHHETATLNSTGTTVVYGADVAGGFYLGPVAIRCVGDNDQNRRRSNGTRAALQQAQLGRRCLPTRPTHQAEFMQVPISDLCGANWAQRGDHGCAWARSEGDHSWMIRAHGARHGHTYSSIFEKIGDTESRQSERDGIRARAEATIREPASCTGDGHAQRPVSKTIAQFSCEYLKTM